MVHPVSLDSDADEVGLRERDFIDSTIRDILSTRTKLTQIQAAALMAECSVFGTEFAELGIRVVADVSLPTRTSSLASQD